MRVGKSKQEKLKKSNEIEIFFKKPTSNLFSFKYLVNITSIKQNKNSIPKIKFEKQIEKENKWNISWKKQTRNIEKIQRKRVIFQNIDLQIFLKF